MAVGQFTKAKEGAILGGDFSNAVFGTVAISFNDYICAIDTGSEILILDDEDVEYYAAISKKGMSRKTSNLINATTHAVISTLIPGASLAGAIAGHTAAAAAGVATGNAAAHVAGGIRDYRDVIVVFRDQKKCIIRCSDLYFKKIKKYCEERKLSEYEIDELLNNKSKRVDTKASLSGHAKKTNRPKHKYANDSVSSSRGDRSSEKQNYLDETHECPRCHNKISKGDKYCSSCGAKIEPKLTACYNCGHKLRTGDNYCPTCGHPTNVASINNTDSPKTNTYELPHIDSEGSHGQSPIRAGQKNNINGIDGWLAVFVISLILNTINTFMNVRFLTKEDCYLLQEYGSDLCYAFEIFQNFEGLGLIFLGGVSITAIILILGKQKVGQVFGIILPLLYLVFSIIDMIWLFSIIYSPAYKFPSEPVNITTGKVVGNLLVIIVYCSVWIPYLLYSKRVRNTLTRV